MPVSAASVCWESHSGLWQLWRHTWLLTFISKAAKHVMWLELLSLRWMLTAYMDCLPALPHILPSLFSVFHLIFSPQILLWLSHFPFHRLLVRLCLLLSIQPCIQFIFSTLCLLIPRLPQSNYSIFFHFPFHLNNFTFFLAALHCLSSPLHINLHLVFISPLLTPASLMRHM